MKAVVFHDVGDIRLAEVAESEMGNCNHRQYIPHLLELVRTGAVTPETVLTRHEPLTSALDAYKQFDTRQDGWLKVALAA